MNTMTLRPSMVRVRISSFREAIDERYVPAPVVQSGGVGI